MGKSMVQSETLNPAFSVPGFYRKHGSKPMEEGTVIKVTGSLNSKNSVQANDEERLIGQWQCETTEPSRNGEFQGGATAQKLSN